MTRILFAALLFPALLFAQDRTSDLEAKLSQTRHASPAGAALLLELIDIYHQDGRAFGLVRNGQHFIKTHPGHPRHAEVMVKLIDGLQAAALTDDIIATCRQFAERHPQHPRAGAIQEHLARTLARKKGSRHQDVARAWEQAWRLKGPDGDRNAWRALARYEEANNGTSFKEGTRLATEMVGKLPPSQLLTATGLKGMHLFRRSSDWAGANAIANQTIGRKTPMSDEQKRDMLWHMADNYRNLKQYNNAAKAMRGALNLRADNDTYRRLIQNAYDAQLPAAELERLVNDYARAYPEGSADQWAQGLVAHACAREKNTPRAAQLAEAILQTYAYHHDIGGNYIRWTITEEDKVPQAEQGLKAGIAKNTRDPWRLRYHLAFSIYRDRLKDPAKTRQTLLNLITKSPTRDSTAKSAIFHLLDHAKDDAQFQQNLKLIVDAAAKHPEIIELQNYLHDWARDRERDKARRPRTKLVRDAISRIPNQRDWAITRDRHKGYAARAKLLGTKLGSDQRMPLLQAQVSAHVHHHRSEEKVKAVPFLQELVRLEPDSYGHAARLLELAHYGKDDKVHRQAVELVLKHKPTSHDPASWIRVLRSANRFKDPALTRRCLAWINDCHQRLGRHNDYARDIGAELEAQDLPQAAMQYWQDTASNDPHGDNGRQAAWEIMKRTEDPATKRTFLSKWLKPDSDNHGAYSAWLADTYAKEKNWNEVDRIMRSALKRQQPRFPRRGRFEEYPAQTWLDTLRGDKEAAVADQRKIYTLVRDMQVGRTSAAAQLALLELPAAREMPVMERLVAAHEVSLTAWNDSHSWDRLRAYADTAANANDWPYNAALLSGMLANLYNTDGNRRNAGREQIARAYTKMGALGLDIAEDSPLAPLLEIGLYLRLGDREKATQSYLQNQALFDDHKLKLPTELVLFAAETHMIAGGEDNHTRAEDLLRAWTIAKSDKDNVPATEKAQVQLLLGQNYYRSGRYDVARSEFTSVKNAFPDTDEAIEADFGIGESFMAQKVYDKAEEIFADLARNRQQAIAIRAEFLRGVLANRQGDRDEARAIFRTVLERVPDVELANATLYNLAEVYGVEQRYMDQLELLRTVGRLGQQSKRWHTPGQALSIVVQDSDLGISRGHTRIPVSVRTVPGGDTEQAFLASGGAGKGLFMAEIPTVLGAAQAGDNLLQLKGNDTIEVDYPEEFKQQFKYTLLAENNIEIASDALFDAKSQKIEEEEEESFSQKLRKEAAPTLADLLQSQKRPADQIKPGNPIYIQVKDSDRDRSSDIDTVAVKVTATSGDEVTIDLPEVDPHSGIFEGTVPTGELPAGALATDSAIEHNPLMAIDHDRESVWQSQPDGATPKSLTIDMKNLFEVSSLKLHTPDPEHQAPVRVRLEGSYDGRYWIPVGEYPRRPELDPLPLGEAGPMSLRLYPDRRDHLGDWNHIKEIIRKYNVPARPAETIAYRDEASTSKYNVLGIWHGKFIQRKNGAIRFHLDATQGAIVLNQSPVARLTWASGRDGIIADTWVPAGIHELTVIATGNPQRGIGLQIARENPNAERLAFTPIQKADLDLQAPDIETIRAIPLVERPLADAFQEEGVTEFKFEPWGFRHLRTIFDEYLGEAVAVSHVQIQHGDQVIIPPAADVLALAVNDTLEITAGDTAEITFVDAITAGGKQRNRLLSRKLSATYHNAKVEAIAYDYLRGSDGAVNTLRKQLMRIDPGERIGIEITDFDMDATPEMDSVPFEVSLGTQHFALTAIETEENSGVFRAEVETVGTQHTNPPPNTLVVRRGDTVNLRYQDEQNTFPGHATWREAPVFVAVPTEARIRVVGTTLSLPEYPGGAPKPVYRPAAEEPITGVTYDVPLTVEVYDPDAARDNLSSIEVQLSVNDQPRQTITCRLSEMFGEPGSSPAGMENWALYEGRFMGQMIMQLGGPDSPAQVPYTDDMSSGLAFTFLSARMNELTDQVDFLMQVLNVTGPDILSASYNDALHPSGTNQAISARARLRTDGKLAITGPDYKEAIEQLHVGEKLYLTVNDPDMDRSDARDLITVRITTDAGEQEDVTLEETLTHSGQFSGSFLLKDQEKPTPGNKTGNLPEIECFFGNTVSVHYADATTSTAPGSNTLAAALPVAIGTDGALSAFSKVFGDPDLAIQTQFHIAESHFELFKGHLKLEREEEADKELEAGRRVLNEIIEDYPDPKYTPRVAYLLGQFAQELEDWPAAIESYRTIVRDFGDHTLAADAQYKLAQCYEEAGEFDEALESYVTLASTYPKNPLIANVMIRINEYFYRGTNYPVAAQVGSKFVERFEDHEFAPRMAFRVGQCFFKQGQIAEADGVPGKTDFVKASKAFDDFAKRWPDDALCADALFWSGESHRTAGSVPEAFRRYNRCRWDFPESDAAKYARGRLALPEMIAQFEREANLEN